MRRKKETQRRGFTLVELLVVIVILSMLAGIVAPKFFSQITKAKVDSCPAKMAVVESAIETFLLNTGEYPVTLDELLNDPGIPGWTGPYLQEKQLYDPWDRPFDYIPGGRIDGGPLLISYGDDGVQGGTDDNADITNE
ncbi:MAG: type II secretion system major pseudopilin GspG [Sedimentisphaerales bacterium]|jgi:general secretion pathway protein G